MQRTIYPRYGKMDNSKHIIGAISNWRIVDGIRGNQFEVFYLNTEVVDRKSGELIIGLDMYGERQKALPKGIKAILEEKITREDVQVIKPFVSSLVLFGKIVDSVPVIMDGALNSKWMTWKKLRDVCTGMGLALAKSHGVVSCDELNKMKFEKPVVIWAEPLMLTTTEFPLKFNVRRSGRWDNTRDC